MFEDVVTSAERRAAYLDAGLWDEVSLAGSLAAAAVARPAVTAVVDRDGARRHSYADLDSDVSALAAFLGARGVGPGDVVSVQLPNWYETVVADVAAQRIGAVVNPLLPIYRRREIAHVLEVAHPKVIFTPATYRGYDHHAETRRIIDEGGQRTLHVVVADEPATEAIRYEDALSLGRAEPTPPATAAPASSVSELIFTSGTEAAPKAIMHTEQTATCAVRLGASALSMGPGDVVWMPSPIGHSTGFNFGVRLAIVHGFPLVLQDRWEQTVAFDLCEAEGCTYTLAATTFLQDFLAEADRRSATLPAFSRFGCGGAPVPPELVRRAEEREIGVLRLYGSTEGLVVTWNRPDSPLEKRLATDGIALDHVDVEVREGGVPVESGTPGEIFLRGPNACVGFYADPERTRATFDSEGFIASGDLATIDEDGYLTIVGRKKEIIIRGGMNITPREIEDLILTFPEVDRVAVVGIADERLGERVCACVVPVPGASLDFDTLVARLRQLGLATYKLPQRLEILESLPMTASGKVQKHEIVRQLDDQAATR